MDSETHASYAKVGLTIVLGVAATIVTLVYLGGIWDKSEELFIETCYDRPVSGLSVGSVVNFRGVAIGEVRKIGFIGDKYDVQGADNTRIYILLAINSRKLLDDGFRNETTFRNRVKTFVEQYGMRASVVSSGITGLSRVEMDFNHENPPVPPKISWVPQCAYVPPKMSLLDDFSVAATKVMNQINKMDLNAAWSNVNTTVESLAQAADGAKVMIETRQADVERLLEDLNASSASIRDLVRELRQNPSLMIRERVHPPLEETE